MNLLFDSLVLQCIEHVLFRRKKRRKKKEYWKRQQKWNRLKHQPRKWKLIFWKVRIECLTSSFVFFVQITYQPKWKLNMWFLIWFTFSFSFWSLVSSFFWFFSGSFVDSSIFPPCFPFEKFFGFSYVIRGHKRRCKYPLKNFIVSRRSHLFKLMHIHWTYGVRVQVAIAFECDIASAHMNQWQRQRQQPQHDT